MASVRTRSASPKSVSFSPVLERKYSIDRAPSNPPELKSQDWRKYFNDFSAYLGKCIRRGVGAISGWVRLLLLCGLARYIGCVLVDRSGTGSINKPCAIAANAFAELFVSFYLFDGSVLIASLRAFECVERFVMFFAIIRFSMYGLPISIAWDINHICQRGPWSSRCWLLPICYLFGNTRLLRFLSRGKWR